MVIQYSYSPPWTMLFCAEKTTKIFENLNKGSAYQKQNGILKFVGKQYRRYIQAQKKKSKENTEGKCRSVRLGSY